MIRHKDWALIAFLTAAAACAEDRFRPGEVHLNQTCRHDTTYHYNLYVPTRYKPGTPTPILYVFAPGGNADVRLFQTGAEKVGWLVCGSVESRNGQTWDFYKTLFDALQKETSESLTVDPRRVYYTGMSGGARVAYELLWRRPDAGAGVIGMGAGILSRNNVPPVAGVACVGTVGRKDFNYWEVLELKYKFARHEMPFRFIEWDGGHDWAPPDLTVEAIQWLDYQFYLYSTRLSESEKERLPKVLESYLEFIGSMKSPLDAYEVCEDLVRRVGPEDPAGKRAQAMIEGAKEKLASELRAKRWVEDMIHSAIRQGGAIWYGEPAIRRARQLADHYANTVYGRRAKLFAETLADQLKRKPPPENPSSAPAPKTGK